MNIINHKKPDKIVKRKNNSAHSSGVTKRKYVLTNQYVTDLLATPIKITIHGHGVNNLYYVGGQKENDYVTSTATGSTFESGGGPCRSVGCLPGRQVYFEDVALKFADGSGTGSSAYWTANLRDMMYKAYQDGRAFSSHYSQPAISDITDKALANNKFIYHGGCVIHKWTNTLTTVAYMEFREFTPRQLMGPCVFSSSGTNYYKNDGLYRTLYKDFALSSSSANGLSEDSDNNYDDYDDRGFKYSSNCLLTNARWCVGKPVIVKLQPGETYTYKMILHPFQFKHSEFALLVLGGSSGALNSTVNGSAVYVPGFTKHLYMRAWGETGAFSASDKFADGIATTNELLDPMPANNVNITEYPVTQLDRISTASVRLGHTRSEYHKFRGLVWNANSSIDITKDYRDFAETKFVPGTDPLMYTIDENSLLNADLMTQTAVNNGAPNVSQST